VASEALSGPQQDIKKGKKKKEPVRVCLGGKRRDTNLPVKDREGGCVRSRSQQEEEKRERGKLLMARERRSIAQKKKFVSTLGRTGKMCL